MGDEKSEIRFRKTKKGNYRNVKLYFRDQDGTFKAVPGLRIMLRGKKPLEVYTLNVPIQKLDVSNLRD